MAALKTDRKDRPPLRLREILSRLKALDLRTGREAADDVRRERDATRQ